jgi:hypothetical protein
MTQLPWPAFLARDQLKLDLREHRSRHLAGHAGVQTSDLLTVLGMLLG